MYVWKTWKFQRSLTMKVQADRMCAKATVRGVSRNAFTASLFIIVMFSVCKTASAAVAFSGNLVDLNADPLAGKNVTVRVRLADGTAVPIRVGGRTQNQLVTNSGSFSFTIDGEELVNLQFLRGNQVTKQLVGVFVGAGANTTQTIDVAVPAPKSPCYCRKHPRRCRFLRCR